MVRELTEQCNCAEYISCNINSSREFDSIKLLFDEWLKSGKYIEITPSEPIYEHSYKYNGKYKLVRRYAEKWYKCLLCDCLWELVYPDFPSKGSVTKFKNSIYTTKVFIDEKDYTEKVTVIS